MQEFPVADSKAVPDGEVVAVSINDQAIAIARVDGKVYAFDDRCTHEECPLSDGLVEGTEIECWRHGARFDLQTGAVTLPPATSPLIVHTATERDGTIFVVPTQTAQAQ